MTIDTARPRAAGGYNFADHGRVQAGNADNMILAPNSGAEIWTTSWANTLTTIRLLPARNPDGSLTPYRNNAEQNSFGDWIRSYLVFKGGQNSLISFVLYDHASNPDYDLNENPAYVLYWAIKRACDSGQGAPSWFPLLQGGAGRGAALSKPSALYLSQALLLEHKHKVLQYPRGLGPNDKTLVMQLSSDAGRKMVDLLNMYHPHYQTGTAGIAPTDFEHIFLHGDPVSYDHGRFIRFCQAEGHLSQQQGQQQSAGWTTPTGNQGGGGGSQQVKGYDVRIDTQFGNLPGPIPDNFRPLLESRAKKWSDLIRIPSEHEQVLWLARAFPGDAIEFAFRDHPDWLSAEVTAITRARGSVAVPPQYPQGGYPPQGGYQQPGGYPPAPQGYPAPQAGYGAPGYPQGYPPQQPGAAYPGQPTMPQQGYQQPGQPPQADPNAPPPTNYPGQPATSGYVAPAGAPVQGQPGQPAAGGAWGQTGFGVGNAGVPGADPALRPGQNALPGYGMPQGAPGQPGGGYGGQPGAPPTGVPNAAANAAQAALAAAQAAIGTAHVGPQG